MLRRAGNAPNQMADTVKVESPLYFPVDHVAQQEPIRCRLSAAARRLSAFAVLLGAE